MSGVCATFAFTVTQDTRSHTAEEDIVSVRALRIRAIRSRANLTQKEFAQRLVVSERSVQDWEAGKSVPRPAQRRKIERFADRLARREAERLAA